MPQVKNNIFIEFKAIKEYWQIVSIFTTIIFFCVYFYLENKDHREKVEELAQVNKELKDRISRLEGQIDVMNSNMALFVEKNPGLTKYRLETLEEQMETRYLLDALNKKTETEIKIIEVPVFQTPVIPSPGPQPGPSVTKEIEQIKTPVKSRWTRKKD